jgi:nicotinamidase-related amidase
VNIVPTSAVLIVVDAQVGFVTEHSETTMPVIADLLHQWQSAGGASVLTQFVNAEGSPYVRLIGWSELMPGDAGVELDSRVAPLARHATEVIRKSHYSALTDTVKDLVEAHGWQDIYIAGLDTESCVLATALAAFESDLTPWVVTDAVASHAGPEAHAAGLLVMGRFLGKDRLLSVADLSRETPARRAL